MYSNIQHSLPHRVRRGYDILSFGQRAVRILRGSRDMRQGWRQDIMYHQGEHCMPCTLCTRKFLLCHRKRPLFRVRNVQLGSVLHCSMYHYV